MKTEAKIWLFNSFEISARERGGNIDYNVSLVASYLDFDG